MRNIPKASASAIKRVKDKLPVPTECHYCGGKVILTSNAYVYGKEYGKWPYVYACLLCEAYVGVHNKTHIPLGTLANQAVRNARSKNKEKFIELINVSRINTNQGYSWLAKELGISKSKCHWGWFGIEMCNRAGTICDHELKKYNK